MLRIRLEDDEIPPVARAKAGAFGGRVRLDEANEAVVVAAATVARRRATSGAVPAASR